MRHLVMLSVVVLAGCASQPLPQLGAEVPGFFLGLWHGWIAPFAVLNGLFSDVRIYAFPNTGWWYDFGFILGCGSWTGAATAR